MLSSRKNPILNAVRRGDLYPEAMLWALEYGAHAPRDPRSKVLLDAAQVGGSYLQVWNGDWTIHRQRASEAEWMEYILDQSWRVLDRIAVGSPTMMSS